MKAAIEKHNRQFNEVKESHRKCLENYYLSSIWQHMKTNIILHINSISLSSTGFQAQKDKSYDSKSHSQHCQHSQIKGQMILEKKIFLYEHIIIFLMDYRIKTHLMLNDKVPSEGCSISIRRGPVDLANTV